MSLAGSYKYQVIPHNASQKRSGGHSNASSTSPLTTIVTNQHEAPTSAPPSWYQSSTTRDTSHPLDVQPYDSSAISFTNVILSKGTKHQSLLRRTTTLYQTVGTTHIRRPTLPEWRQQQPRRTRSPTMRRDSLWRVSQALQPPSSCCTIMILHQSSPSAASGVCSRRNKNY